MQKIDRHEAERTHPGMIARTAMDRANVFLRMLVGERQWSGGWEREIDHCFEMGDGDEVVWHLIRLADADPAIDQLLSSHWNVGPASLAAWRSFAATYRPAQSELTLT